MKKAIVAALGMVAIVAILGILLINGYVKSVDLKFLKVEFISNVEGSGVRR